jgi:hypothetical protein
MEPINNEKKPERKKINRKKTSKGEKTNKTRRINNPRKIILGVREKKKVTIVGDP